MFKKTLPLLLSTLLLISCSREKGIKLSEKSFDDEVSLKGVLSFTFNKEMVPDSLIGKWVEDKYLEIEPAVEGKVHWQTNRKLVFVPTKAYQPATYYMVKFKDDVFQYINGKYGDDKSFEFHTPMLNLVSGRAYWEKSEMQAAQGIKVNLEFNYGILPSTLKNLLEIKVNGKVASFEIITYELSEKVDIMLSGLEKEDKDYPVEVKIEKGLTSGSGGMATDKVFVKEFEIPSPFILNITDIQSGHDGSEGTITLYTTQEVNADDIKSFIEIEPAIKYQVDIQPGYFIIKSEDFSIESKYEIIVKKGLLGKLDGELKYEYNQPVSFGKIQPTIRFNEQKEYYLSGNGSRDIGVAIINVPNVNVKIWKVYENNIIKYLSSNSYYYNEYDDYDDYDDYGHGNDVPYDLGDVIYEKEIETESLPRKGSGRLLNLDFEDRIKDYKGIYVIEIKSSEEYRPRATKMISISDIGLIVKKGKNHVTVFANSIKTAQPLSDVSLHFIGSNNQVAKTIKTDAKGVAIYEYSGNQISGFEPVMVTAQLGDDYNIIHLNRTTVNTSRFDVGGKWQNPGGMEAFIYGDRNLYRPGETANISAIVRDYAWNSPGNIPVIVKITSPGGKTYKIIKKVLNKYGSFETQVPILATAGTGSYVVDVFTSNEVLIASSVLKVEEFMPDRIKVEFNLNKDFYIPGETVEVDILAENFFGPPAADRDYEVEHSTSRIGFYPKKNRDYNYYIEGTQSSFSNEFRKDRTDMQGKATEHFVIPPEYRNMGILRSNVFVIIFDETGRPVNRLKNYNIYTQDVFFGLKSEDNYVKTGQNINLDLIAVDKDGNEQKDVEAEISLIRYDYKTVLSKSSGYFRYRSEKVEKVLVNKKIRINEKSTNFGFIPELSGYYEFRIKFPGVHTYVARKFYAYGWGNTTYSSFKVNNEGQIDIEPDKEKYNVGEKAKVLLKSPFSGKILITLETDKVIDHFYIETDKRAASFELDIKPEYLPNIYISATLFRPHEETDIPLTVAHGFAPVKVDNPDYKLPIDITAVEKSRSNTRQTIKVKSRPNTAMTIAVVDEGILQVAQYKTPDPYGYFYQKRALQVFSSDIYPYLFPEINAIRSKTGGGDGEMGKRLNPMQNNRVKLVSFWSGILETNGKGEASFDIDIPQFSGDLRIMAIGYEGQVFGSAQKNIKVADPLVLSVALPRFLSPKDKIDVPVVMTNTTDKNARCIASIITSGPLKVIGESKGTIEIPANSEGRLTFNIDALPKLGEASVTIEVEALEEKFTNKTDITVRPSSTLQKRSDQGVIPAGNSQNIIVQVDDFMPSSIKGKLIVSKNPMVRFTKSLDYLVKYPYGCVEQTVSAAFPQLYYGDLLGIVYSENRAANDAVKNVQTALDRIKLMQLYNGGLTYWPGSSYETWWGSVYAAHFAVEAKKAGFEVDETFLKYLLKYLKKKLESKETFTYYFNGDQKKVIAPKEVTYSLYVLAMAGEKPTALMNYYRNKTELLSLDSKYLLAGAYMLTGDEEKAKQVLPKAFEGEKSNTDFGGSFYSFIRDEAIALNVLLEVDAGNPQVGIMAKHISDVLQNQRYLNTQERIFGLLAMGKMAKIASGSDIKGSVSAGGKTLANFNNQDLNLKLEENNLSNFDIKTEGSGNLYYFWECEGISQDGSYVEEDSYLKVRKKFYTRNGLITNNQFKQNDLVLVQISIIGLTYRNVENVAICDILPACFEIENPRLTVLPPGLTYPKPGSNAQFADIRDDRIIYFTNVNQREINYYYLARVVSTGTFKMGPVSADAMYNGEYHSYHGAGEIVVTKE